jgi:Uma2 family endonuclease
MGFATKPITASEFVEFVECPENRERHFELERGSVVELPLGGVRHGVICANAAYMFGTFSKSTGCGFVCSNNPGFLVERNPDTVRGPDLAWFSGMLKIEDERRFSETPPALIVEVVEAHESVEAIVGRVREFLVFGTPTVWVIDPLTRSIKVFSSRGDAELLQSGDSISVDAIPGFRCKVAEFFTLPGQQLT